MIQRYRHRWACKKLADSCWPIGADEPTVREQERIAKLYQQALDAGESLKRPSTVSNRLNDIER